ncbi:hypothetical protein N7467_000770 [Penicillium canescens]|nr:hypothetical protein N7467_000770 [Penicillium canescens]
MPNGLNFSIQCDIRIEFANANGISTTLTAEAKLEYKYLLLLQPKSFSSSSLTIQSFQHSIQFSKLALFKQPSIFKMSPSQIQNGAVVKASPGGGCVVM